MSKGHKPQDSDLSTETNLIEKRVRETTGLRFESGNFMEGGKRDNWTQI